MVERLRRAGAIILGKTNTPEFLASYETDNFITGRTNNPWDVERTPGGSSGGEAAAIASGCSPGGVGSDGGGSIRVPAHFCGIAGLKPTPGRISIFGHRPVEGVNGIAAVGPMARSVADVRLLFEALAGYDERDPLSAPVPLRDSSGRRSHRRGRAVLRCSGAGGGETRGARCGGGAHQCRVHGGRIPAGRHRARAQPLEFLFRRASRASH